MLFIWFVRVFEWLVTGTWGLQHWVSFSLGETAFCRPTTMRGCKQFKWTQVLLLLLVCRVGEAMNPGPNPTFSIGAFNPSGLKGKAPYIVSQLAQGDIWVVSETHLCRQTMQAFRSSLHFAQSQYRYCIGGYPVPSQSSRQFHNAWRGVAILS